ncbi:hypothetical protein HRbin27_01764 [bacterium HR27]|nr:hypothetical protein HRbin27_01764 [bacterium HR27]
MHERFEPRSRDRDLALEFLHGLLPPVQLRAALHHLRCVALDLRPCSDRTLLQDRQATRQRFVLPFSG